MGTTRLTAAGLVVLAGLVLLGWLVHPALPLLLAAAALGGWFGWWAS